MTANKVFPPAVLAGGLGRRLNIGDRMTKEAIFALSFRSCSVWSGTRGAAASWIAAIVLALISQVAIAETYTLVFDSNCSSRGEKLDFSCKAEPSFSAQSTTIFFRDEKWLGIEGASLRAFPLGLIKNDDYVMVFDYPVLYSGIATIVLMKKTGRFYMSEIAYSDALEVQEVSVEAGRFTMDK